jgi:endonuclease/exonuclease/phosphatase family metal-dependent hydrolase
MRDVLSGNFAAPRWTFWPQDRIRVVNWNIERGLQLGKIIAFLEAQRADILVLQEADLYARRTGFRNIGEEIAKSLRMNYAFGYEFEELAQGRRGAPAYHGQTTLSSWPLGSSRVLRFRQQSNFWKPKWFLPRTEPFQPRRGGRIALITEVEVSGRRLMIYNLHLESRADDRLRMMQLAETVEDAKSYLDSNAVIVAGDLNADLSRSYSSAAALDRLGFHSAIALPAAHTTTPRGIFGHQRTIDWVYLGGPVESISGGICDDVDASDHYPIWFELKLTAA